MVLQNPDFATPFLAQPVPLREVAVRLHPQDDVAIAKVDLPAGMTLVVEPGSAIRLHGPIPGGHKIALRPIPAGGAVRRYGQAIGLAARAIQPGEHVHTHNLGLGDVDRQPSLAQDMQPRPVVPEGEQCTFLGYRRADGRVGTRNYIAVLSTVNCSAHASLEIAHHFTPERLHAYPNVDGVVAFTHHAGCTNRPDSLDHILLRRTLTGIARHPNVGACLLVGLGCETNQVGVLAGACNRCALHNALPAGLPGLVIQELGGLRQTVEAGIAVIEALLPQVNAAQRSVQPLSALMLALQCGGSDSWSGVTANPVVGLVGDEIVRQGGAVVLAETPEIYGAEHLLVRRAIRPEVAESLLAQVRWWEEYARRAGMSLDDNRSVGNEAGGLTTIYEKSLGAIAKAGSTPLTGVYGYAEPVTARGLAFMNTPGFDPVSVTGQIAGGCNLVLFTTGRGSVLGSKPAPTIKISSNPALYRRMSSDIDLDAGRVLEGASLEEVAVELLGLVAAVASGQPSKSEAQGVGEAEFSPWCLGGIL
jgi:altronate hydrolase